MRISGRVLDVNMPALVNALIFAVLIATYPFTVVMKILLRLPPPLASSHGRWSLSLNVLLIGWVTACVAVFIYRGRGSSTPELAAEFLIAALCYAFGLVLMLRQFAGVYPEFIVTTSAVGLGVRKTTYRNIQNVVKGSDAAGETRLLITTTRRESLVLTLPTRDVGILYERFAKMRNEE